MLDNRLKKVAELVSGEGIACDVGTDHAYLAAELINSGKCSKVIASDVKEGPLDAARSTVEKYGIQDKVELVLSDGLDNVDLKGVTDIVIAGMGGETIAAIIERIEVGSEENENIQWILQPMTKPEILRKRLTELNLFITNEYVVEDGDKMYVIICAEYSSFDCKLTEAMSICGYFDENDETAGKYLKREAERLEKVAENLSKAGRKAEAQHYAALAEKAANGIGTEKISDLLVFLDERYPFAAQEKWDNSGYLVETSSDECSRILLSLDISDDAVNEANSKYADLIISHHPVIFEPRKKISCTDPVYKLIKYEIGAVCMHTNLDIAAGGTNGVILQKLTDKLELAGEPQPFEELGGGNTLGWIIELKESISGKNLAQLCKSIFGCEMVRTSHCADKSISRIAFCSGSGGSMLGLASEKCCDALITGDVKHDVWIDANNLGIAVLDCGHFHTENLVLRELRRVLEERFPRLDIEIAESSVDPCEYV
ncbi:Nif3-like dinuclear metal center hexameric protein [Ruminococcus sp.]|uniref:Nif3-like dinuclear metal center hexameric protein n=1 Tax=Ruminococcus sp. TaxID=41978 RepID=UPI0025DC0DE8|nr:Nif3-like dinuclear metal center hexameric protein [Ruminococcus sp.]MCR4639567.1 Nif3-like dinuclear metal center hexameric protein [Ruminococcus sp.]